MSDPVNPQHYTRLNPQPIDVIEAWGLDYHLASAVAYIARAGFKGDAVTDLRKARWYIERKIEQLLAAEAKETK